jgi:DNA-binding response OmpR family regulator
MHRTDWTGVLIVDPDPRERDRLAREVEACGWWAVAAPDAAAAVEVCAERRLELGAAVVDLQLPGLQGSHVLAELGRLAPGLARFAMAAGLPPYAVAAFRRLSDTPLLAKPVRGAELVAAVREAAAGRPLATH